jgi:hypothetical protein
MHAQLPGRHGPQQSGPALCFKTMGPVLMIVLAPKRRESCRHFACVSCDYASKAQSTTHGPALDLRNLTVVVIQGTKDKPDGSTQRPITPRHVADNARDVSGRETAPFAHRIDSSAAGLAVDAVEPFLQWSLARVLKEPSTRESSRRSIDPSAGDSGSMHAPGIRLRTGQSEVCPHASPHSEINHH